MADVREPRGGRSGPGSTGAALGKVRGEKNSSAESTAGSTKDSQFTLGVDSVLWTKFAKKEEGGVWHGAEKLMAVWHEEEEEASRLTATAQNNRKRESR